MEENQKAVLEAVFGESSDGEDFDHYHKNRFENSSDHYAQNPSWEPVRGINGLWLCRDFLSPQEQSSLLSTIEKGFLLISHSSCVFFLRNSPLFWRKWACGWNFIVFFSHRFLRKQTESCVVNVVGNSSCTHALISVVIGEMGDRSCVECIELKLEERY